HPVPHSFPTRRSSDLVGTSVLLCFNPETSKEKDNPPPHFAYGHQHIAFEVLPEEYNLWKTKIQKLGIEIIQEQQWKNNLQSFYRSEEHTSELQSRENL